MSVTGINLSTQILSGTVLPVVNGGTGQTSYTDGQLLIGNTTGNTLAKTTLAGTANQVVVTNGSGSITLSTPQNIATTSTPTFSNLTLTNTVSTTLQFTLGGGATLTAAGTTNAISLGGGVILTAGIADFTNNTGTVLNTNSIGGGLTLTSGNTTATGAGNGTANAIGGNLTLTSGNATGTRGDAFGGSITLTTGTTVNGNLSGGSITLTAFTSAFGGNLILTGTGSGRGDINMAKLTASTALVSDASKNISSSAVTSTELGYLSGVTSSIQTQLNGKQATGNYITALTGDATATGPGSVALTLATVNGNVGSFGSSTSIPSLTVNAKGLITAASGNVVIAPAGTLTGTTLASNVVTSSLTSVGTITSGTWQGAAVTVPFGGTGLLSLTAYAVLAGGTTSAGAMQQVSGLGTSGQVLTSNGAAALPTWQNTAAAGANTALSNLASVAINTTLVSDTTNTDDLGSSSIAWRSLYLKTGLILQETGAGTDAVTLQSPSSITTSYSLVLPNAQGTLNQTLVNDGSGNLSWGIGSGATAQYINYIIGTVSGSYTGSLTIFDLPFAYVQDGKTIQVMYDGVQLIPTDDYTETTTTRVTTTQALIVGQKIAFRAIAASGVAQAVTLFREDYIVGTVSGSYTGSTTVFNLANSYTPGGKNLTVYLDGDLQTVGATIDYLETNSTTVTFNNALVSTQKVAFLFSQSVAPGSGIVNAGTTGQLAYYSAAGSTVIGTNQIVLSATSVNITGALLVPAGSAAAPAIAFTADATAGIYRRTSNTLSFAVGGVAQMEATTSALECFNGLDVTGAMSARTTGVSIKGTTTNNSAAAGYVGEYVTSHITSNTNFPATTVYGDLTSISLTAGNWIIGFQCDVNNGSGVTVTGWEFGVSTTSGNDGAGLTNNDNYLPFTRTIANGLRDSCALYGYRVALTTTTIHYLKYAAVYAGGTAPFGRGKIYAVRVR